MSTARDIAFVAVDWGTSHLRVWTIDSTGGVIAGRRSAEGMRETARDAFVGVLDAHLIALGVGMHIPVLMCGMVGSRQGWQEARYVETPCNIGSIHTSAARVQDQTRDIRILPGLAKMDAHQPDVMRAEETQLLGLHDVVGDHLDGLVCMPGSHAKWVRMNKAAVESFSTALTGELFASLLSSSVLKHAVTGASGQTEPDDPAFIAAANASLSDPAGILTHLFSPRPRGLLSHASADDAHAFLSGTIIGQDVAGAIARYGRQNRVWLVASGALGSLYARAFDLAGITVTMVDGDELVIAGLTHAAREIWPQAFNQGAKATGTDA